MSPSRSVLMIAFQFPPFQGSSGVQRTLKFVRYLPQHQWRPILLSAANEAYERTSPEQLGEIPPEAIVRRAWARDAKRHFSIRGRYPAFLEQPDRWASWLPAGVLKGLSLVREHRPAILWSTYPIPTALRIGYWLKRLTGLPWVVDFRDAMVDEDYPAPGAKRRLFQKLEHAFVHAADRVVLTTESARDLYAQRYPGLPESRWSVIRNGYDEENFVTAEERPVSPRAQGSGPLLLHSGLLQPSERNPRPFLEALAKLHSAGALPAGLRCVLRGSGHDTQYAEWARSLGLGAIVELAPPIPYYEALAEMLTADGLLLFQGSNCNHLVPAKLYEYFRAGRPVLALTDVRGETGRLLVQFGSPYLAAMDDVQAITVQTSRFLGDIENHRASVVPMEQGARFSRRAQTAQLASLFEELAK